VDERIRLDEIMKALFSVSKRTLVNMLNHLFQKDYDPDATTVDISNNEFVSDNFSVIKGDLFYRVESQNETAHYHLELQSRHDSLIAIRAFQYGLAKADETRRMGNGGAAPHSDVINLHFPNQIVIVVERNDSVPDALKLNLIFPDGREMLYSVPTMKYWEYDAEKLVEHKMYPLLPLQVFQLRRRLDLISNQEGDKSNEIVEQIRRAVELTEAVAKEADRLYKIGEISNEDFMAIVDATTEIFRYLNARYLGDEKWNTEVKNVTMVLYDPVKAAQAAEEGKKEGRIEGNYENMIKTALKMIRDGCEDTLVIKYTELSASEIVKLRQSLQA